MIRRLTHLAGDRRGGTLVEAALVFPVVLSVLFGLVEYGRLAWTVNTLNFAVQEAARCASVRPDVCGNAAATAAFASQRTTPLNLPARVFSVANAACGVRVEAAYNYPLTVGALVFKTQPVLRARACRT
jgi:Flp pilus assembly protein TadG